jgi:hypothetical protein
MVRSAFDCWVNSSSRYTNYSVSASDFSRNYTISLSKDNEAARRKHRRRILHTLRKPTTQPTKLAKESELVWLCKIWLEFLAKLLRHNRADNFIVQLFKIIQIACSQGINLKARHNNIFHDLFGRITF